MKRLLAPALIAAAMLAPTAASAYQVIEYYDPNTACTYTVWVNEGGQPVKTRIACR